MPKFPSPYLLKMWLGGCLVAVKWLFIFYTQISIAFTGGCTASKNASSIEKYSKQLTHIFLPNSYPK